MERNRERRVESTHRRRRRLDANRERRSRVRHLANRRRHQPRGQPPAPRAGRATPPRRASARSAVGGAGVRPARRPFSLSRRSIAPTASALWERRIEADGDSDAGARQAQPRDAKPGHRRRARRSPGSGPARSSRSIAPARSCGSGTSPRRYGAFDIQWGHGSSPVLYGDLLILLCDQPARSYLLALDKATGKDRWKADRGQGRVVLQHAARRAKARPATRSSSTPRERIDAYDAQDGSVPLAHRRNEPLCRCRHRCSTTA